MYYPRGYEMLTNGNQTTVWRPMKSREIRSFLALTNVSSIAIVASSLIIEHTVNFALPGNSHGPCNFSFSKADLFPRRVVFYWLYSYLQLYTRTAVEKFNSVRIDFK